MLKPKSFFTALLAAAALGPAIAGNITILNPDFTGAHDSDPANWTTTDLSANVGIWNDGAGGLPDAVLAFKDPTHTSIIQQNLSSNNAGLTAASHAGWNISFDYGWRTNTAGGDAVFTISLIDLSDNSVLDSETLTVPVAGHAANNTYTLVGTADVALSYDNTVPGLEAHDVALRIQRTDADNGLGGNKWLSTAFIDSIGVTTAIATPPAITSQPQSATAGEFGPHTFSVVASGSPPLVYQWKRGGVTLDGETSTSLVLANLTPADAGDYSVTVTNDYGSETSSPATLNITSYNRNVSAAAGVLSRLLPQHANRFIIEFTPPENGADVFELDGAGDKIVLRGNTGVSVASALHHYLREFCGCHVSRNGDQLALPTPLPRVTSLVRIISPHQVRFFYNPTTFGYTSAWWGWDDWQREIDLLALHGVNLAQVTPGAEELFRRTLRDHFGYTDVEIRAWLCMPSHLPWMLLGNMHGFGGPVPASVIDRRLVLGQQICTRMAELGIQPVLQGFYGMVPQDFKTRYPAADVRAQGGWVGGFQRPDMLNPNDPVFATFSQHYYQNLASLFPGVRHFAADPFHEGGDTTGIDLAGAARALLDGMAHADPQAVWVAEAWSGTPKQEMLDAVNKDRVLVLDLNCSNNEQWRSRNAFNNTPWVWCAIQNFGGNTGMIAKLGALANRPAAALADPGRGRMAGIGAVPEASDTIPAAYELLFEHAWSSEAPDLVPWVRDYAKRRYGKSLPALEDAWDILLDTSMNQQGSIEEPHNSIVTARPSLSPSIKARTWSTTDIPYNAARLAEAWNLMLDAAPEACLSDAYRFDLADVARQVLCDLATRHQRMLGQAHAANDAAAVHLHGDRILEIIADLETLSATRPEWLLGTWIKDARTWGMSPEESALCEKNARILLSTWSGSVSDLNDYANREWSGLLGGFYLPRWQQFLTALYAAVDNGQPFDETTVRSQIGTWEVNWGNGSSNDSAVPVGNTVSVAQALWTKYGNEAMGRFDVVNLAVGTGWSPAICSTRPVSWTRDLSAEITQPGTWVITFQYTSGSHALQINEVSLTGDGIEIDRDVHRGWTGVNTYDNRYYLRIDTLPSTLTMRAVVNSAGGTVSNGTIQIARCDEVPINAAWSPADCSTSWRIWTQDVRAAVTTPGDYRLTLSRSGGDSALTIDRVWLEEAGDTLDIVVDDGNLDTLTPTRTWTLRLAKPPGQATKLKIAVGSATATGSTGTVVLEKTGDLSANPVCWPQWTEEFGLNPALPGIDTDHDGVADVFEYLQGSDPLIADAIAPCGIQTTPAGMMLQIDWAADRVGTLLQIQGSADMLSWADATQDLTWIKDQSLPGGITRRQYRIDRQPARKFFRLQASPQE